MPLPVHPLGTTGMDITSVGFGAWAIGGGGWAHAWGPQDDNDSIAAIRHAVEAGINWIDTAAAYGLGHSEEIIATALRDLPEADRPYVFTKCGMVWDDTDRGTPPAPVATPASLRAEATASIRRLGVDHLDLLQLHWPPQDGTPLEEYWPALLQLREEGLTAAVGLSNHTADQLTAAEKLGHVDTLQPPFSAIHRGAAASELPWCDRNDTGVIVYSPMQSGLLTGSFTTQRATALPPDDWRSRSPDFTGDGLRRNLELAETLGAVAARHGTTTAAVAVSWTLAWPAVTGAIVGARRPEQVDGWLPAADLALTHDDLHDIAATIRTADVGEGPDDPTTAIPT